MYTERYPNSIIDERLKEHISKFGINMEYPDPKMKYGSSDMGNVSIKIPSIHSYIKIADKGTNVHSTNFTKAANSPNAHKQILNAAKAMALTGYDILTDKIFRESIYDEFHRTVPQYNQEELS